MLYLFVKLAGTFLFVRLALAWMPLRMALTPKATKIARGSAAARSSCSRPAAEQRTEGRTGILLYLSLLERRAEIVADEAIHSQGRAGSLGRGDGGPDRRGEGRPAGRGMALAVEKIGAVLARCLPPKADNPNELPDRLIEL